MELKDYIKPIAYAAPVSFDRGTYELVTDNFSHLEKYILYFQKKLLKDHTCEIKTLFLATMEHMNDSAAADASLDLCYLSRGYEEMLKGDQKIEEVEQLQALGRNLFNYELLIGNLNSIIFNACIEKLKARRIDLDLFRKFAEFCEQVGETIETMLSEMINDEIEKSQDLKFSLDDLFNKFVKCVKNNIIEE